MFTRSYKGYKSVIEPGDYPDFTEQELFNLSGCAPLRWIGEDVEEEVVVQLAVYDHSDMDNPVLISPEVTELQTVTKWRFMNNAELKALEAEEKVVAELNNIETLQNMCEIYQKQAGCNGNFFAMLTAVRGVAKSTGQPIPAKAQACLDWLDSLWAIYYTRKANKDWNHNFSEAGTIPHSFTEVREESE